MNTPPAAECFETNGFIHNVSEKIAGEEFLVFDVSETRQQKITLRSKNSCYETTRVQMDASCCDICAAR